MLKMLDSVRQLISTIHHSPSKGCINITGGGAPLISQLLGVGGASGTVMEAGVPYNSGGLHELVNYSPASYLSPKLLQPAPTQEGQEGFPNRSSKCVAAVMAFHMAIASHLRAIHLSHSVVHRGLFGLGATSSIATTRARQGLDQGYISLASGSRVDLLHVIFSKAFSRDEQDDFLALTGLKLLAGLSQRLGDCKDEVSFAMPDCWAEQVGALTAQEKEQQEKVLQHDTTVKRLWLRETTVDTHLTFFPRGSESSYKSEGVPFRHAVAALPPAERIPSETVVLILSGSFNPVHEGHIGMAEVAACQLKEHLAQRGRGDLEVRIVLELSEANADKGVLSAEEVERRVEGVRGRADVDVVVTRAPLFSEKALLCGSWLRHRSDDEESLVGRKQPPLPEDADGPRANGMSAWDAGCYFAVGYDTAIRLLNNKYYGHSDLNRDLGLRDLSDSGCRFIVSGRKDDATQEFHTFEHLERPATMTPLDYSDAFAFGLDEADFRKDISSSEIRRRIKEDPTTPP